MEIPWKNLSSEALEGVIGEFVTREGTDNGYTGSDMEDNIQRVRRMLESGDARLTFDQATGSCNITPKDKQ